MKCLGTYCSIEICQKIDVRSNYLFFIIIMNFLFFKNSFADIFKFFQYRLFNKNYGKSTANVCEQWDSREINNWIRLFIFENKSKFLFPQPVPKQLIGLL